MGRRSSHTSEELRDLIVRETTALVVEQGYGSLSAREIARRIDYSPGTLYNVFENLDDLVITIEGQLIDRLIAALSTAAEDKVGRTVVLRLLHEYLNFAQENQQLWRLLGEHRLSADTHLPGWYQEKLASIQRLIASKLATDVPASINGERLTRAAHGLWVVVHGIAGLATSSKLNVLSTEMAHELLDDLINTYINGLVQSSA